jgi:hypothetical protein
MSVKSKRMIALTLLVGSLVANAQTVSVSPAKRAEKTTPVPAVGGIMLGVNLSEYPACDSPQAAERICSTDVKGKGAMLSWRPDFPKWASFAAIVQTNDDGQINNVVLQTKGIDVQESLYRELVAQYGKAKSLKRTAIQNRMGATFQKIDAAWVLPWGAVIFEGVSDNLEEGMLSGSLYNKPSRR